MPRLTEGYSDRLRVPAGARDVQAFDTELPGFGVRKFKSGRASYFLKFNVGTQQRRLTLGAVVKGNLKAMRLEASRILSKARLGTDVVAEQRASASRNVTTLGQLVPRYFSAREAELRPEILTETTRYLKQSWLPLHALPVDAITRQNIVAVIDDLEIRSGKVSADRARAALSAFFAWCIDRGYVENNPTMNVRARAPSGGRTRVLSEGELVEVWQASLDDDYGKVVKLLILSGQRRGEIGGLAWSEVNLDERQIELPPERTKNGRAHVIPLSDQMLAILKSVPRRAGRDLLFSVHRPAWAKEKAAIDQRVAQAGQRGARSRCRLGCCTICAGRSSPSQRTEARAAARDRGDLQPCQRAPGRRGRHLQSCPVRRRAAPGAAAVVRAHRGPGKRQEKQGRAAAARLSCEGDWRRYGATSRHRAHPRQEPQAVHGRCWSRHRGGTAPSLDHPPTKAADSSRQGQQGGAPVRALTARHPARSAQSLRCRPAVRQLVPSGEDGHKGNARTASCRLQHHI